MKRVSKILCISFLLTGCSIQHSSIDALKEYSNKFGRCQSYLHENTNVPPENKWFESLSKEEQLNLLSYLFQFNNESCMSNETVLLKNAFSADGNEELLELFVSDSSKMISIAESKIEHLNKDKVKELRKSYNLPFDLVAVAKKLDLLK